MKQEVKNEAEQEESTFSLLKRKHKHLNAAVGGRMIEPQPRDAVNPFDEPQLRASVSPVFKSSGLPYRGSNSCFGAYVSSPSQCQMLMCSR